MLEKEHVQNLSFKAILCAILHNATREFLPFRAGYYRGFVSERVEEAFQKVINRRTIVFFFL